MNSVQAVLAFQRRAVSFTKTTPVNRPPGGVHELDVPGNPVLHSVLLILLVYTGPNNYVPVGGADTIWCPGSACTTHLVLQVWSGSCAVG